MQQNQIPFVKMFENCNNSKITPVPIELMFLSQFSTSFVMQLKSDIRNAK